MTNDHNPPASRAREDIDSVRLVNNANEDARQREQDRANAAYVGQRRERIATAAMAGYLAAGYNGGTPESRAQRAVEYADALIAELDRKGGE